jgi:hypothetical protein
VEFKFNEAPKVTKSMQSALTDLSLAHLWVVYPGVVRYAAHGKITMLPLAEVTSLPAELLIEENRRSQPLTRDKPKTE